MRFRGTTLASAVLIGCLALSACGNSGSGGSGFGSGGFGSGGARGGTPTRPVERDDSFRPVDSGADDAAPLTEQGQGGRRSTFLDIFTNRDDPNTTLEVNKYLWNASLDVLNFLPIESADPFSGIIVTGYGTPPGGGRAYRATIHITDPAMDARSLKLAILTRGGGPASPDTVRAVEDAILTRARQLRIRDGKL